MNDQLLTYLSTSVSGAARKAAAAAAYKVTKKEYASWRREMEEKGDHIYDAALLAWKW